MSSVRPADSGGTLRSFLSGPAGLVEQTEGATTSYPLTDAHGDVTALVDPSGAVASRQVYEPWGEQLEGPALEMGWLGAQERRFEPVPGIVQMGVRAYGPSSGRFLSEDVMLGYLAQTTSTDRYAYGWNDPIGRYDLDGRMVIPDSLEGIKSLDHDPETSTDKPDEVRERFDPLKSGRFRCSYLAASGQIGGNTDSHESTTGASLALPIPGGSPNIMGVPLPACSATVSTGEEDGGGLGFIACAGFCVGASTDTGFSFGTGLGLDVEVPSPWRAR